MTIQFDSRDFTAGSHQLMERFRRNAQTGARRYLESAASRAKQHVHSISHELADSIGVTEAEDGSLEVGTNETETTDPHGLHVEFGTSLMAPRPFMRPALLEAEGDFHVEP